jgi:hypothetical protein
MQVFVNISSRDFFYSENYPVSLHRLTRASMGSFPAAFIAPSRNKEYPDTFLHSAEVVTCTHKRPKHCCTTRQIIHVHTSLVWGPVDDPSQSLSSSMTLHTHPFVIHCTIANFPGTTMVLEANFPWTTFSPSQLTFLWPAAGQFHTIHPRHRVPMGCKGFHPLHSPTEWTACWIHLPNEKHGPVHPLICKRKSV